MDSLPVLLTLSASVGLVLGILTGLLPGLGSGSVLLLIFPVLITLDPTHALVLYLSLVISSQYVASVTAIYTGIPGAESAAPTAKEFPTIRALNLTNRAVFQNAIVSVLGNVVGLVGFLLLIPYLFELSGFYKNNLKAAILTVAYITLIVTEPQKVAAFFSIVIGSLLMTAGFNAHTYETINLGWSLLDGGFNWVALMMGALIGSSVAELKQPKFKPIDDTDSIKTPYIASGLRGSVFGFFIGFVPGLSYILSSMLSYSAERRYLVSKKTSLEQTTLGSLAASEAAQSSGTISMLIPLLVFAIPITISEGIILNAITLTNDFSSIVQTLIDNFYSVVVVLFFVNVLSFCLALQSRYFVKLITKIPVKVMSWVLVLTGLVTVIVSNDYYASFSIATYLFSLLVFYMLRINPLPFVMSMLLFPTAQSTFYLFKDLL